MIGSSILLRHNHGPEGNMRGKNDPQQEQPPNNDTTSEKPVAAKQPSPGGSIDERSRCRLRVQGQTPQHDDLAQNQISGPANLENITYMSSPDPSTVDFQSAALHSPFDMSGLIPGAELYETPWETINCPIGEPPSFNFAFGENKGEGGQFDFEMPFYQPQSGDWQSSNSHCSSVSNETFGTDAYGVDSYSEMSNKKRHPGETPCDDSDSETESRPSTMKKLKHSSNDLEPDSTSLIFACPFLKRHPQKHRACAKYMLRRVRDVKQHLNRRHRTPDYYCARCYEIFNNAKERDDHTRGVGCVYRENPHFEGITEEQREQLNIYKERNKMSSEDQWFIIWDILFPNVRRPTSVSCYSPREEAVALLREVWSTRHSELLAEVAQVDSKPAMANTESTICRIMDRIFDHLEESNTP